MRRPDGVQGLGVEPRKKRSSSAASMGIARSREPSENPEETEQPQEVEIIGAPTMRRKSSRPQIHDDGDESDGVEGDEEYAPPGSKKTWGNINIEGRRKLPGRKLGEVEARRHSLAV